MNSYWQSLVSEFENRHKAGASYRYLPFESPEELGVSDNADKSETRKRIYLDGAYSDVYFTWREAVCVAHAMHGRNIPQIGEALNISGRTVEYYLKNVRKKMECARLSHVIHALIEKTSFNPEDYL